MLSKMGIYDQLRAQRTQVNLNFGLMQTGNVLVRPGIQQ